MENDKKRPSKAKNRRTKTANFYPEFKASEARNAELLKVIGKLRDEQHKAKVRAREISYSASRLMRDVLPGLLPSCSTACAAATDVGMWDAGLAEVPERTVAHKLVLDSRRVVLEKLEADAGSIGRNVAHIARVLNLVINYGLEGPWPLGARSEDFPKGEELQRFEAAVEEGLDTTRSTTGTPKVTSALALRSLFSKGAKEVLDDPVQGLYPHRDGLSGGHDLHSRVAAHVYGVREGAVTNKQRQSVKEGLFLATYGVPAPTIGHTLGIDEGTAENILAQFRRNFPHQAALDRMADHKRRAESVKKETK